MAIVEMHSRHCAAPGAKFNGPGFIKAFNSTLRLECSLAILSHSDAAGGLED